MLLIIIFGKCHKCQDRIISELFFQSLVCPHPHPFIQSLFKDTFNLIIALLRTKMLRQILNKRQVSSCVSPDWLPLNSVILPKHVFSIHTSYSVSKFVSFYFSASCFKESPLSSAAASLFKCPHVQLSSTYCYHCPLVMTSQLTIPYKYLLVSNLQRF